MTVKAPRMRLQWRKVNRGHYNGENEDIEDTYQVFNVRRGEWLATVSDGTWCYPIVLPTMREARRACEEHAAERLS